jgi:hypothetical protein
MGLGGSGGADGQREHYAAERERELRETEEVPQQERAEVAKLFRAITASAPRNRRRPLVAAITANRALGGLHDAFRARSATLMRRARAQAAPDDRGLVCGGGLIPLLPYIVLPRVTVALGVSIGLTLLALFVFGAVKARFIEINQAARRSANRADRRLGGDGGVHHRAADRGWDRRGRALPRATARSARRPAGRRSYWLHCGGGGSYGQTGWTACR